METRNIVALILLGLAGSLLVWFIGFGGSNPFKDYLNVRVGAKVSCLGAVSCWYSAGYETVEMSTEKFQSIKNLAWICFPIKKPSPITVTLTVDNPDGSQYSSHQEQKVCNAAYLYYYFKVPLDKGAGIYMITAEVCGSEVFGQTCRTETRQYTR